MTQHASNRPCAPRTATNMAGPVLADICEKMRAETAIHANTDSSDPNNQENE